MTAPIPIYRVPNRPPFPVRFRGKYIRHARGPGVVAGFVGQTKADAQVYLLPLLYEMLDARLQRVLAPENLEVTYWVSADLLPFHASPPVPIPLKETP